MRNIPNASSMIEKGEKVYTYDNDNFGGIKVI